MWWRTSGNLVFWGEMDASFFFSLGRKDPWGGEPTTVRGPAFRSRGDIDPSCKAGTSMAWAASEGSLFLASVQGK